MSEERRNSRKGGKGEAGRGKRSTERRKGGGRNRRRKSMAQDYSYR